EIRMLLEVERTSGEAVRCAGPTRMTPSRHRSVRNPAAQQSLPRCAILWSEAREGPASEPVKLGLVPSLNRPGGNVTGGTFVTAELGAKQLGLLHELQPGAVRIGVLVDPNFPVTASFISDVQAAVSSIRKQIEVLEAPTGRDI